MQFSTATLLWILLLSTPILSQTNPLEKLPACATACIKQFSCDPTSSQNACECDTHYRQIVDCISDSGKCKKEKVDGKSKLSIFLNNIN
jgi:hypothetical protein